MKALSGLMSIHVVCYLVKERLLHCFKCLMAYKIDLAFISLLFNFYADARSRKTYINWITKKQNKKIRKILVTKFYLLFSFDKREANLYMVSKLCNSMSLQYLWLTRAYNEISNSVWTWIHSRTYQKDYFNINIGYNFDVAWNQTQVYLTNRKIKVIIYANENQNDK